jgi:5-methylcytosine-specific restriction endonuclease McrA
MDDFYRTCAIPKPEPSCITKARKVKLDAKNERAAREIVRKRDGGKCRIPGCIERGGTEMHHIIPRSRASKRRFDTRNLVTLCRVHHQLRHAGVIQITGDADDEIFVTGDTGALRFRL